MSRSDLDIIRDKIWLTSKCRMNSETRYRRYAALFHLLIATLSVLVIGVNLITDWLEPNYPITEYTIFLSVFILVFSLIVYGFHFERTAAEHRECYLKLQKLGSSTEDAADATTMYHQILDAYPNHAERDFHRLILQQTLFNEKELTDSSGEKLTWNNTMLFGFLWHQFLIWVAPIIGILLVITPIIKLWA